MNCLDGTVMYGEGCTSCGDCAMYDLNTWGGKWTCDADSNTWYYDEDNDGDIDDEGQFDECWYDSCDDDDDDDDEDCDIETSDDRSSSPSDTTNHGAGKGWCYSALDDHVGCTASPGDCWAMCLGYYGDGVVAIDWDEEGSCYCQNDCECMEDVGDDEGYLITRDGTALPQECEGDEDEDEDEDEDW